MDVIPFVDERMKLIFHAIAIPLLIMCAGCWCLSVSARIGLGLLAIGFLALPIGFLVAGFTYNEMIAVLGIPLPAFLL